MRWPAGRERLIAWYPLLLGAYPVLFLWSQNVAETSASDVIPLLVLAVGITAIALGVLTLIFRDARRAALIVAALVISLMMYGHVANLLEAVRIRPVLQQLGWIVMIILATVAAIRLNGEQLERVTRILDRVAVVLVVITLVLIVPAQLGSRDAVARQPSPSVATAPAASGRPLRDVYYVVLDRYGSDRAIDLRFGVKNDFTAWLTDKGFKVLPDSRANYVKTTMSMASTLNMTHLGDLAARMGPGTGDHKPIFEMLQAPRVAEQFKALGYTYTHIGSYYSPTRTDSGADRNLYVGGPSDFGAGLYDASAVPAILARLHINQGGTPAYERHHTAGLFEFKALDSVRDDSFPKFVLAHLLLPHPPYTFAADGSFLDAEDGRGVPESERFANQLHWTNEQLKAWLQTVLALPEDEQPIIILQGDEGPYPAEYNRNTRIYDWSKATPDLLEQKYGILNAWYVPGGADLGLTDSQTSVNTFPALFSGYFGLDVPRLPDRVFTSESYERPYDLTDVTDRLDSFSP